MTKAEQQKLWDQTIARYTKSHGLYYAVEKAVQAVFHPPRKPARK